MRNPFRFPGVVTLGFLAAFRALLVEGASGLIEVPPTETYTNAASRFQYPPKIGNFERERIQQHDNRGRDIGVGYNYIAHAIAITVFVYPIPLRAPNDNLEGHFDTCKNEILSRHIGAQLVAERTIQLSAAQKKRKGKQAVFTYTDNFAHQRQPVRSELSLFTHGQGQWFVKFTATYPTSQHSVAESDLKTFLDQFTWP